MGLFGSRSEEGVRRAGVGTGGKRGETEGMGDGTGTGGYSRDARDTLSLDLLLFLKSFVKFLTDILWLPDEDAPADSSVSASPDTTESAEKRLEGCGSENVRGGGSRTAGVAGRC